ncbi:MAG TPA: bile acid:sodium symporter family protein, partial [Chryseolinea sp.]|nr:bile acid:sodium symporter family protein [Chryseolinea sp.]
INLHEYAGWLLVISFGFLALNFQKHEVLKGYSFTIMIFAAVTAAMYYPQHFIQIGDFKLSKLIIPLMQIIMFGMGTTLSLKDFGRVMQMPKGVVIGVVCQYSIMPLVGWSLTKIFTFPPEVAAGIILIGSCPSGLASNVMSYLARANVALSVTLTAIATLLAPLMTPMLMQLLAGQYVSIDFWGMVVDITKIIIVPVGAGLIFNHFLHGKFKVLDDIMPVISMLGIGLIIVVITAAGRNDLLIVGPLLILACFIHNVSGYFLGYWASRALRMPEVDCRTIALEVGLQNGGLGSGLALAMGKLSTVGLAPAVFSPIMNSTGSSLALWWRAHTKPEDITKRH